MISTPPLRTPSTHAAAAVPCGETISREVLVANSQGLHARPADMLAREARRWQSRIELVADAQRVDGKSILDVLTLAAEAGIEPALDIELAKRIPSGAGLGGGSSDAAVMPASSTGSFPTSPSASAAWQPTKSPAEMAAATSTVAAADGPAAATQAIRTAAADAVAMVEMRMRTFGLLS